MPKVATGTQVDDGLCAEVREQISEIMTGGEVRFDFKVTPRWLERHIESGDIVPLKAGRLNRFCRSEIIAYLERKRTVAS